MEEKAGRLWMVWVVVALIVGAVLAVVGMTLSERVRPAPIVIQPPPPTATAEPTVTPSPLRVYVSGEVVNAAVYELPAGSIVGDAIEAAGHFSAGAAEELINLAQPLADGMHIYVPHRDEIPEGQPVLLSPSEPAAGGGSQSAVVNINNAGLEELETLPGVGPATAQNILDYRAANGRFEQIEDIMNVSGIGPAKFEQMKELIEVD